jgi:1,2-diacylglycerol 3-alpha-glucosyltransferase
MKKILIHWPKFGPYHVGRLNETSKHLTHDAYQVIGLEVSGRQSTYVWQSVIEPCGFYKETTFPEQQYEDLAKRPIKTFTDIYRHINKINPDVIATNGYSTLDSWTLIYWAWRHSRPLILMSDSKEDDFKRNILVETVKRKLISLFSAALCAGRLQKEYLLSLGLKDENIFLGYDAVDNAYFASEVAKVKSNPSAFIHLPGLEKQTPFFLASSRFLPRKNILGLLEAFQFYASSQRSPWRLVILGDGEERMKTEDFINKNNLSEYVTLAGIHQITVLPAYYGLASIFIHPAKQDQWGLVVNEAMASGLPVLVSEESGCSSELVVNGENGFTFKAGDTKTLAMLMENISRGDTNISCMGRKSQEIISRWGLDRFANGFQQAVNKCGNS